MELETLWKAALGEIELHVSRPNFFTWLKQSRLVEKSDGVAVISLPSKFAKEWVENKYYKIVLGAIRNLDETTKKVEFLVLHKDDDLTKKLLASRAREEFAQLPFPETKTDIDTNLNPRYALQSFVVGKANEFAHAAAQAIISEVGTKYNPFFVYGGVGIGKTHLIQGIGNEIKTRYLGKVRVRYVPSEKFTNEVIAALRTQRMDTIKEKYRTVDVLIIDDIQFIAGKAATEEEFFHTFNALYDNNKQIILTSDKPPKFLPVINDRLKSRFEMGMVADIGAPDYEMRTAIILSKLLEKKTELPNEIIDLIAVKMQRNVREIEGLLNRILFYQAHQGRAVTQRETEEMIKEIIEEPVKNIKPEQVIRAVAECMEIAPHELINRSRKKEVAEARQIAMYLLREMLQLSYPFIGKKLGRRDHTTAIYAYEKISNSLQKNQGLIQKIIMIKEYISKISEA